MVDPPLKLPMMIDFDVTVNNVDKVARTFRGGAGPSGTDAEQLGSCQIMLLSGDVSVH